MNKAVNGLLVVLIGMFGLLSLSLPAAWADDLDVTKVPVYRERAGYGIAVTEYSVSTEAELIKGEQPEHTIELMGLIQPPDKADVLCFGTTLIAKEAEDERGKDLLLPQRRGNKEQEFKAVLPSEVFRTRRGEPLLLCPVELESIELDRAGYEVAALSVVATAVVVEDRESEEIDAVVADRYIDIGHDTEVQVSSIEVDKKGEMTVKLNVKRSGDKRTPVIDSLYALNKKGKAIGGGRWTNELELFNKSYEVELIFPLTGDEDSIDQLQIVLATEYDIEEVQWAIEDLFNQ